MIGPHPFHAVGEKYIVAVAQAADCLPLLIPVLETPLDVTEILARVDGIFFPGSPSNVEPARYAGPASVEGTLHQIAVWRAMSSASTWGVFTGAA